MICEKCKAEGKRSQIRVGGGATTLQARQPVEYFYDEDGRYHAHDPNPMTVSFCCSNGHEWGETSIDKCWCNETRD